MDDLLFNPFSDDLTLQPPSDAPTAPTSTVNRTDEQAASLPEKNDDTLSQADIARLKTSLLSLRTNIDGILEILKEHKQLPATHAAFQGHDDVYHESQEQKGLEGIFDGEKMIGDDAGIYAIPPNYASKSKLVEGDRLKLTITPNGSFIYKQVKPIARRRVVGELVFDHELNQWGVFAEDKLYKVLKASVTFYKGTAGDDGVILIPEGIPSSWGAIENIIHKTQIT